MVRVAEITGGHPQAKKEGHYRLPVRNPPIWTLTAAASGATAGPKT